MEGLIFGGAYLRREICVSKPIGLALRLEANLPFLLCFIVFEDNFPSTSPRGAYIWRGDLKTGFFCVTGLGGLYLEGLIFGILRYVFKQSLLRGSRKYPYHPYGSCRITPLPPTPLWIVQNRPPNFTPRLPSGAMRFWGKNCSGTGALSKHGFHPCPSIIRNS